MPPYFSYGEQSGHYFRRDHETVPRSPLDVAAAWRGSEIAGSDAWRAELTAAHADELRRALDHAGASGKPTGALSADDFPLPTLATEIARWRATVTTGLGLQLVSGLPVEEWSQEEAERCFWCLGLHMGRPGAQNVAGDLLGHVCDTGDDAKDPFVRLYRTASHIAYHCDAADVVGLLCLRPAKKGGASRVASSVTVYNQLLTERPDLVERLFEPFLLDVRNEDPSGALRHIPIPPCRYADGQLRTFYHSDYFRSVVRHDDVPPLDADEQALLDLYEEIAARPEVCLDVELAAGDIQWLSNHTIIHSRTAYEDYAESDRRRHLLRLWLSIE